MQVITVPNILEPTKSFKTEHDFTSIIDYLQFQYPDGFKVPHVIYLNDKRLEVADYDKACVRDDYVVIAFSPAAPLVALAIPYLINFAIAAAVTYVIGEIFKPDIPKGVLTSDQKTDAANVSSVYNLSSGQNRIGLGQPIPSIYGRTRVYPSLVEQPYFRFQDNDMYLYQMMAISVGNVAIEELFVSESKETDLAPDDILSKTYRNDSFDAGVIKSDISTTFNDDNYHMRVKTLPEVSGLELRGAPASSLFTMSFANTSITFYEHPIGIVPDLSSLVNGSKITISDTNNNDGVYIVSGPAVGNVVPIESKEGDAGWSSFTTEPSVEESITLPNNDFASLYKENTTFGLSYVYMAGLPNRQPILGLEIGDSYIPTGATGHSGVEFTVASWVYNIGHKVSPNILSEYTAPIDTPTILTIIGRRYSAEFKTSYGAYTLEDTSSSLDSIEIDVEFPRGMYNSNTTTGAFEDRTILLEYKLIGSLETLWLDLNDNDETYTEIGKTNTPQRRTYNLPIPTGLTDDVPLKIRLRRSSPEVEDNYSQDQAIVTRIKSIYNEPDINDYGDITLLWVRAKATNAISSAGQFQINAWVNRIDVEHDLASVITDVYTNTEYGAGLPLLDLDLPATTEVFNGALDSKITVMDALRMIGKAGRYTIYLDGQNVKMRKDEVQLIRTALFNETNILKNSFKLDYLFGEDDGYDGMSVKYRSSADFKEAIATYPETSINPQVTELIGCTDFDIALSEATYGWLQKESRRKVATFSTDIQGIIPNYLDRIGITHNVPDWGLGGQIETVDGNHITINCQLFRFSDELGKCDNEFGICSDTFCEIEPENINYNTIIFRKNDGSVSDLYTFSIVDEYNILLNETPPAWLYTGYDYDNTFFSIGESNTFIKDYIVTEISPRGNNVVDVKCINYDDSVYEAPYLVDDAGDNLTDGSGNYLTV